MTNNDNKKDDKDHLKINQKYRDEYIRQINKIHDSFKENQ